MCMVVYKTIAVNYRETHHVYGGRQNYCSKLQGNMIMCMVVYKTIAVNYRETHHVYGGRQTYCSKVQGNTSCVWW